MRNSKSFFSKGKPTYAIVVDGKCEVWYFQMLKRFEKDLSININPTIATNLDLTRQIKIIKNYLTEENYDIYEKIFWVVDFDVIEKESKTKFEIFKIFYDYIQNKHPQKVVVIINNPCLEFWFLLHYKDTSKPFSNCEQAEKELKKFKEFESFEKTQNYFVNGKDIYKRTKENLETAIRYSKKLGRFDIENPYKTVCEMWKFFEDKNIKSILK